MVETWLRIYEHGTNNTTVVVATTSISQDSRYEAARPVRNVPWGCESLSFVAGFQQLSAAFTATCA